MVNLQKSEQKRDVAMETEKKYFYEYEEYAEGEKGPETIVDDILADPEFKNINKVVIGCWGNTWEDSCQTVIDNLIAHAGEFSHITGLFIGDMDYEECEVSWIIQGNYGKLWTAMPWLKELTIKGSQDLVLGEISHDNLESLTIICGGLPVSVIQSIQKAKLPNLKKLLLYIGSDYYGFDGDRDTVANLLENMDFPKLKYLGITDSEIQDELAEVVVNSRYMDQIETLDLSNGTLTDKGGELILKKVPACPNIKKLDLHYHYLSDGMMEKLKALPVEIDLDEKNEPDHYNGEIWMNAMLTE